MTKKSGYTPNDHRSIAKNPTSAAHSHDLANRHSLGHAVPPAATEPAASAPAATDPATITK